MKAEPTLRDDELPELEPVGELVQDPTCFVFGGVAFEVCVPPGLDWTIGAEHRQFTGAYSASPVAAEVRCVVSAAPELSLDTLDREIRWEWTGEVARVVTCRVRAELRCLGPSRYAATAMVSPDEAGCASLMTALAAAVVEREGGFVLHAASVVIDGRAVLFVGPSGAGKTTAANHCEGARWLARDRAVVYPTPLGWYAAGMAGGDTIELPRAPAALAPLAGILRIRRGPSRLDEPALSGRLRDLRESVVSSPGSPSEENARLERLLGLASASPVGELAFELGRPLSPVLSAWLNGGSR